MLSKHSLFVVAAMFLGAMLPVTSAVGAIVMPGTGISAHRGASATHPENTLAAIEEAIRLGVHQMEIDVEVTSDGHLVLMHDSTLTRTTNAAAVFPGRPNYNVSSFTLAELKQLDAGSWKGSQFAGEKIPTLEEALAVIPANMWVNLDIKSSSSAVGKAVAEEVFRLGVEHQAFMSVRGNAKLGAQQAMDEAGKTILLNNMDRQDNSTQYVDETVAGGFDYIQFRNTNPAPLATDIQKLEDAGVTINYCCTDDAQTIKTWLQNGADFVLVNDVAVGMQAAGELGIAPLPEVPEPASLTMLLAMGLLMTRRARR